MRQVPTGRRDRVPARGAPQRSSDRSTAAGPGSPSPSRPGLRLACDWARAPCGFAGDASNTGCRERGSAGNDGHGSRPRCSGEQGLVLQTSGLPLRVDGPLRDKRPTTDTQLIPRPSEVSHDSTPKRCNQREKPVVILRPDIVIGRRGNGRRSPVIHPHRGSAGCVLGADCLAFPGCTEVREWRMPRIGRNPKGTNEYTERESRNS